MTPITLIRGALRAIGVAGVGSPISAEESNDALETLNAMLDQWSTQKLLIAYQNELVFQLTPTVARYTFGPNGSAYATLMAAAAGDTLTVSGINGDGRITRGAYLGAPAAAGTRIDAFRTGAGGGGALALGTYQITPDNTFGAASISARYERPLNVRSAFVRYNAGSNAGLDQPVEVCAAANWQRIVQKDLPGPWPQACYYERSESNASLFVWPVPTQANDMHVFADALLSRFARLDEDLTLPQGYELALRYNLAELLMIDYGQIDPARAGDIRSQALAGRRLIKASNAVPQELIAYDQAIVGNSGANAGWILTGGFSPT